MPLNCAHNKRRISIVHATNDEACLTEYSWSPSAKYSTDWLYYVEWSTLSKIGPKMSTIVKIKTKSDGAYKTYS